MLTSPGASPVSIITTPSEVESRLKELHPSLGMELLLEANKRGFEQRLEMTPAHPPTGPGTVHWIHFVGALRSILTSEGWSIQNRNNCPLILSPDRRLAIMVMTGNADTGKEHGDPTNQADKGPVLDASVRNNAQYDLFEADALDELENNDGSTQLWVLLYHVELDKNGPRDIRTELSFPSNFGQKKITEWGQRIILKNMDPRNKEVQVPPKPDMPIDFDIERKSGT